MQALAHPVGRADQRGLVDEVQRNRCHCPHLILGQVLVLDRDRCLLVAHANCQPVVEVLFPTSHATYVERRVGPNRHRAGLQIVAENDRDGGNHVEAVEGLADLFAARGDRCEQFGSELRVVEDGQPSVEQLTGEFQILRPDRGQIHRDFVSDGVHGERQRLTRTVWQRQGEELPLVREALAAQGLAHDLGVLPGAGQGLVELDAMPALRDLGP